MTKKLAKAAAVLGKPVLFYYLKGKYVDNNLSLDKTMMQSFLDGASPRVNSSPPEPVLLQVTLYVVPFVEAKF